jgi:hypothetical protein
MVQLGSFILNTNSISQEDPAVADNHAVGPFDNDVGVINQTRSDMTFRDIPIIDIIGSAAFIKNPQVILRLEQMNTAYNAANMIKETQLYSVYISGHGPSHQEWSSGGGLSSINFLVAKKDPLSVDVQAADDKSMSPIDQLCTVRPMHSIRLRFSSFFNSGPNPIMPMPRNQAGVSFPHTMYIFTIHSID